MAVCVCVCVCVFPNLLTLVKRKGKRLEEMTLLACIRSCHSSSGTSQALTNATTVTTEKYRIRHYFTAASEQISFRYRFRRHGALLASC